MEKLELEKIANNIRKETISMIHNAKSGHPGGALSATDIFTYLYFNEMNVDPKDEKNPDRDRFVLSKGHTVPALYAVLAEKGYFSKDILMTYRKMGTILQGHPDIKKTPGLDMSTGSLGQGISVGQDGATHQCNEDFALMRTIPGMVVICPSDDVEARAAVKAAYEYKGPVYMRFGRVAVPVINDNPDYKFEIGKGVTLKDGNDLTIIANGILVSEALQASEMLAKDGINARVINIHTIKPLDKDLVIKAAKETGKIITVEEHSVIGGLGSAVADVVSEENLAPVHKIGVQDVFGESALAEELLEKHGLDAKGIYNNIKDYLNK